MKFNFLMLLPILFLMIAMTGCKTNSDESVSSDIISSKLLSSEASSSEFEKLEIMPTLGNTKWGMTPQEAFAALGTTDADWEKSTTENDSALGQLTQSEYFKTDYEIYGVKPVTVVLTFSLVDNLGLIFATIRFDSGDEKTNSAICDELVKLYGKPKELIKNLKKTNIWESVAVSVNEWDGGKKFEQFHIGMNAMRKKAGVEELDLKRLNVSQFDYYPFCTVTNSYYAEKDTFPSSSFFFNGFYAALFDSFNLKS